MIRHFGAGLVLAVLVAGCTEHLTSVGQCPTYCPGGASVFRDTILTPVAGGDTSFTGFVNPADLVSVLVSSGGSYGETRGVFRFLGRGDSVLVNDTAHTFTVDSVTLDIALQARDTTQGNFAIEIYRLPLTVDSATTLDALDALMTPATLIGTQTFANNVESLGYFHFLLTGADLAKVAFVPSDSTRLALGFRVRADGPTAARIGAPASGGYAPTVTTYVTTDIADTTLTRQIITRTADLALTIRDAGSLPSPDLLAVGGFPVARSFLRFELPPALRDSATIIRATLELTADAPVFGIPGDTAQVVASAILADFGAKSPPSSSYLALTGMASGQDTLAIEISSIVRTWQGTSSLPSVVRLALGTEGANFIVPRFFSTRSASGVPRLRITYRPPFSFVGL